MGPLLGAVHDPQRNVGRWDFYLADLDGGQVGASLVAAVQAAAASGVAAFPNLVVKTGSSVQELEQAIRDGKAWGAAWANPGATAALQAAVADPAGAGAVYNPAAAATFAWDEGRSPLGSSARIVGPVKAALAVWAGSVSAQLIGSLNASAALPAVAASAPRVLAQPVAVTELNMFPATQPVYATALTIGQILICVFSLAVVMATMAALTPWYMNYAPPRHRTPGKLLLFRIVAIVTYTAVISATMATIALSLSALSTNHGIEWARVW